MTIGVLDYGMGNLRSVTNLLSYLNSNSLLIEHPEQIASVDKLIIPGVGSFQKAMTNLQDKNFISPVLEFAKTGNFILGICLGMQLLAKQGTEPVECEGLGLIDGKIIKFSSIDLRLPQVGWNSIKPELEHPIFENVKTTADFYFVHSYHWSNANPENILTTSTYGYEFVSGVVKDNIIGLQFHPEKSQKQGVQLMENFINL